MKRIDCVKCRKQSACCNYGAWVDLNLAKKIVRRGIKGIFFHLEEDDDFPSGYKVGTSYEENPCSFLTRGGLCAIHKVDYKLKPFHCREFPYENGKRSPYAAILCVEAKAQKRKASRRRSV